MRYDSLESEVLDSTDTQNCFDRPGCLLGRPVRQERINFVYTKDMVEEMNHLRLILSN